MDKSDLEILWNVAFDAKFWAESAIDLEKAGFPHGYKRGYVERKLAEAEKALVIINKAIAIAK